MVWAYSVMRSSRSAMTRSEAVPCLRSWSSRRPLVSVMSEVVLPAVLLAAVVLIFKF